LVDRLKITSAKIDIACLQHAMFVGVSRPGPACKCSVNSKDLCDERYRPGSEQSAGLTIPTCVQDRLRFSEALRLGDNSHRNRAAVIHKLPQHRLGVGPLLDRRPWAHEHRWTATRPRPHSDAIGGKA
jgi:hypothetical protein